VAITSANTLQKLKNITCYLANTDTKQALTLLLQPMPQYFCYNGNC